MSYKIKKYYISKIILVWLVAFCFAVMPVAADQYHNSSVKVSVDLAEPVAMVDVSPSELNLGEITKGYSTSYQNLTFINKGNLDVNIIPVLMPGAHEVFNSIEFNTGSSTCLANSTAWHNFTYYSNRSFLSIDRPDEYGGTKNDSTCLRLNLENYNKIIPSRLALSANLTIWVMPK